MDPAASLLLCFITAALAGLGAGFFGNVLSAADKQARENGGPTKSSRRLMAVGSIGSTCFGVASIAALYFGPITLVTIIRAGTTLPANALFSQVFAIRPLVKDDYLGTLACICGVVCFVCYQGAPSKPPDAIQFWEEFTTPWAIAWNAVLLALMAAATTLLSCSEAAGLLEGPGLLSATLRAMAVSIVIACASSFMDVAIKGWSGALHPEPGTSEHFRQPLFWTALVLNTVFLIVMRFGTIFGCSKCDVLLFVPLNQVMNVFLSVATGMVVLNEGRNVYSWVGLVFATISVLGGIVMLIHGPAEGDKMSAPLRMTSDGKKGDMEAMSPRSDGRGLALRDEVWRITRTDSDSLFPWVSVVVPESSDGARPGAHADGDRGEASHVASVAAERPEDEEDSGTETEEGRCGEAVEPYNFKALISAGLLSIFHVNARHQLAASVRRQFAHDVRQLQDDVVRWSTTRRCPIGAAVIRYASAPGPATLHGASRAADAGVTVPTGSAPIPGVAASPLADFASAPLPPLHSQTTAPLGRVA